jgi:hypothetical protein
MAPRARVELAIYGLKGRHPGPLDERGTKLSNYLQKQEALRHDRRAQKTKPMSPSRHTQVPWHGSVPAAGVNPKVCCFFMTIRLYHELRNIGQLFLYILRHDTTSSSVFLHDT